MGYRPNLEPITHDLSPLTSLLMSSDDLRFWLRLAFVALPAGRCAQVLEAFQTPQKIFEAAQNNDLQLLEIVTASALERLRAHAERDVEKSLEAMETHAIRLLLLGDADYPAPLAAIPEPPPYLFIRGELKAEDELAVAIVGTRNVTEYGRGLAHKISADLAQRGVTIVSGLARGVDTAAHRGALDGGGRTLAVTACGLDIVYPSDNKDLMTEIAQNGAVLSEWPPTVPPESWRFPARNRIISGLAQGVVVVEAAEKSGALITARMANEEHGREVFAIPGNVHKSQSKGPHALIRDGATLIESADDIIAALNMRVITYEPKLAPEKPKEKPKEPPKPSAPKADLEPNEQRVWLLLDVEPRHIDDVAADAQMSASEINAAMVMLELKGVARRLPGNLFARIV